MPNVTRLQPKDFAADLDEIEEKRGAGYSP
jgi:hypothetical protein